MSVAHPLRLRALEAAKHDLDVRERGGNNAGAAVLAIIRANGGAGSEPWCGDAIAAWYRRAGSRMVQRAWASTIWLLANLMIVRNPRPGHIVVYDFDTGSAKHTGLFEKWLVPGRTFLAIEGNTRPGTASSDAGGGEGVYRRNRSVELVAGWRRINR